MYKDPKNFNKMKGVISTLFLLKARSVWNQQRHVQKS